MVVDLADTRTIVDMRVVSLHHLPFDKRRFEDNCALVADQDEDGRFRAQFLENWRNAWLVVVETSAQPDNIDFGLFWYGKNRDSYAQAAYEERIISTEIGRTVAAFYVHYVCIPGQLGFGDERLPLPQPTPPPDWLWDKVPYTSPD